MKTVTREQTVKQYLFSQNMQERTISKHSGLSFGNGQFYFGGCLDTSDLDKIISGCRIAGHVNSIRSVQDLLDAGFLKRPQDRLYFSVLYSGKSLDDLGRQTGMDGDHFYKYIIGKKSPTKNQFKKIAELTDTSYDFLIRGDLGCFEDACEHENNAQAVPAKENFPLSANKKSDKNINNDFRWDVDMSEIKAIVKKNASAFSKLSDRLAYLMERDTVKDADVIKSTGILKQELARYLSSDTANDDKAIKCLRAVKLARYFHVTPGFIKFGFSEDRMDVYWYQIDSLLDLNGLSVIKFSQALGDSYEPWKNITSGRKVPNDDEIKRAAEYFNLDPGEFSKTQLYYENGFSEHSAHVTTRSKNSPSCMLLQTMAEHHMKQPDLVKATGISNTVISRLARMSPQDDDTDAMEALADYFDMDVMDLFPEPEFSILVMTFMPSAANEPESGEATLASDASKDEEQAFSLDDAISTVWGWDPSSWKELCELIDLYYQTKNQPHDVTELFKKIEKWNDDEIYAFRENLELLMNLKK